MISLNRDEIIQFVEEKVGYTFSDKELLLEALTHSSFPNEMKINKRPDYERLEFLGDAVLELITSEFLYNKYPKVPEGGLSKKRASMVCESSLSKCARKMELGKAIFMGKGEDNSGGREKDSVLCDVTESVLGAIYLDGGITPAHEYVNRHILDELKDFELFVDSKSILQEYVQKNFQGMQVEYKVLDTTGPEHEKDFLIGAYVGDKQLGIGKGKTKKAASQEAALNSIKILKIGNVD